MNGQRWSEDGIEKCYFVIMQKLHFVSQPVLYTMKTAVLSISAAVFYFNPQNTHRIQAAIIFVFLELKNHHILVQTLFIQVCAILLRGRISC